MKQFALAEKSYIKAFVTMPNRLYPLYQLMVLYKETGKKQKTIEIAKFIIQFKPKIESSITREIKLKAREELKLNIYK